MPDGEGDRGMEPGVSQPVISIMGMSGEVRLFDPPKLSSNENDRRSGSKFVSSLSMGCSDFCLKSLSNGQSP